MVDFKNELHRLCTPLWWSDQSDTDVVANPLVECRLLGHICRAARALLGISQSELAEAAGTSRRTIINVESGQGLPDAKTVAGLKIALISRGVSVDLRTRRISITLPVKNIDPTIENELITPKWMREMAAKARAARDQDAALRSMNIRFNRKSAQREFD